MSISSTKSLCMAGIFSVSLLLTGCDDGIPIVTEKSRALSPDRKSVAVLEGVDNGLGFGLGVYYDEIHVSPADVPIINHGDSDPTVVFFAAQESSADKPPTLQWLDAQHLVVTYDPARKPYKLISNVNGVQIDYRPSSDPKS